MITGQVSPLLLCPQVTLGLIFVSRYYDWRPGDYQNGYVQVASYKLKGDAPDSAIETLSKQLVVPLLEKVLADGTILEYEVDTIAVHTEAPGNFWITWGAANPEGIDKVNAAIRRQQGPIRVPKIDGHAETGRLERERQADLPTLG